MPVLDGLYCEIYEEKISNPWIWRADHVYEVMVTVRHSRCREATLATVEAYYQASRKKDWVILDGKKCYNDAGKLALDAWLERLREKALKKAHYNLRLLRAPSQVSA